MAYPIIPTLPTAPTRQTPQANFVELADAFVGALQPWGNQINAFGDWTELRILEIEGLKTDVQGLKTDTQGIKDSAITETQAIKDSAITETTVIKNQAEAARDLSLQYRDESESFSEISLSTANFKGLWSSLTGSLNIPASVSHNDKFWQLLENVADVTTEVPGVSAKWQEIKSGTIESEFSAFSATAYNYVDGKLDSIDFLEGNKIGFTYVSNLLSSTIYYDSDGVTVLATETYTYINGLLATSTWT